MPNWEQVRQDFPLLRRSENDEPLIYLDNAATSQKPIQVIDAISDFYKNTNANVHRGVYELSVNATNAYEHARNIVQQFINAKSRREVIFTKGCTEAINLVASTYGEENIQAGDEIVITIMEHHSNLIPWQQLALRKGAKLKYIKLNDNQELDLADAQAKITDKTKIVAVTQISNVLGTINPIKKLSALAHEHGAVILVDGAQAVAHQAVNVQELDTDFYTFSGHKMYGPTGIGVLYGKEEILNTMNPYQFGGEMISRVSQFESTWADLPAKFEAGTPNIAGAVGLGSAIEYLNKLSMIDIQNYEKNLVDYLLPKMQKIPGLTIYGKNNNAVISFNLDGLHPHDVATALDLQGITVRAGHHCAQPLMAALGVEATVRASLSFYNTKQELDKFIDAIYQTKEFFNK